MGSTPADSLEGKDLGNGWKVTEKITKGPFSTGGCFSVGYKVENNGTHAYLKALDFSSASQDRDPARALQRMTEAYNFGASGFSMGTDRDRRSESRSPF